MVAPGGVHGCSRGHVWLLPGGGMCGCSKGACVVAPGGMYGCSRGACMIALKGGHARLLLGRHVWLLLGDSCVGYDEIRRYDQWAGGTHPTGMHSCFIRVFKQKM